MAPDLPDDPEGWSDEEWLTWLEQVDAEAPDHPEHGHSRPPRSLPSALLGAAMFGLHRVIYGDNDAQVQIVIEADGEPDSPELLEVRLDPDDPDASTVTVRPWAEDGTDGDGRQAP